MVVILNSTAAPATSCMSVGDTELPRRDPWPSLSRARLRNRRRPITRYARAFRRYDCRRSASTDSAPAIRLPRARGPSLRPQDPATRFPLRPAQPPIAPSCSQSKQIEIGLVEHVEHAQSGQRTRASPHRPAAQTAHHRRATSPNHPSRAAHLCSNTCVLLGSVGLLAGRIAAVVDNLGPSLVDDARFARLVDVVKRARALPGLRVLSCWTKLNLYRFNRLHDALSVVEQAEVESASPGPAAKVPGLVRVEVELPVRYRLTPIADNGIAEMLERLWAAPISKPGSRKRWPRNLARKGPCRRPTCSSLRAPRYCEESRPSVAFAKPVGCGAAPSGASCDRCVARRRGRTAERILGEIAGLEPHEWGVAKSSRARRGRRCADRAAWRVAIGGAAFLAADWYFVWFAK